MELIRVVALLGLAVTASAQVCSKEITVGGGSAEFWACLVVGSGCITGHIRYSGLSPDATVTFCQGQDSSGLKCHSAASSHFCNDVPMHTTLRMPAPDLIGQLAFKVGFQSSPAKVCFSKSTDDCGGGSTPLQAPTSPPSAPATKKKSSLTSADRDAIANHHNSLRRNINPSASNMKKLSYDITLERFAQAYLDSQTGCPFQHNPENTAYGENVYMRTAWGTTGSVSTTVNYTNVVQLWYDEVSYYNYYFNTCTPPPGGTCGHFTQEVWDNTERVGCATKICNTAVGGGTTVRILILCNYDPSGNVVPHGESRPRRPYSSGTPCSNCPATYSCQTDLCVKNSEAKAAEWTEQLLQSLFRNTGSTKVGAQHLDMKSKEQNPQAAATSNEEEKEYSVTLEGKTGEKSGWVDQVM